MNSERRVTRILFLFAFWASAGLLISPSALGLTATQFWSGFFLFSFSLLMWGFWPLWHHRKPENRKQESTASQAEETRIDAPLALFAQLNPDPILRLNADGIATLANPAAEQILAAPDESVVGRTLADLLPEFAELNLKEVLNTGVPLVKTTTINSSFFQFVFRGVAEYNTIHAYGTDLTDRRQIEHQLIKALDAAQAAAKAKSEFLATMSHEIRTPMNGIMGMTELLLDSGMNDDQQESAQIILSSADALLTIINDILDFSKIEAGKLELENIEFDLRTCIEEVGELFAPRVQGKGLELPVQIDPELPDRIVGDPTRLRQIITNLVSNAVKFTDQGEIRINVAIVENENDFATIRIDVADTGIGIPQDRLEHLFTAFSQADTSTTRKFGGTGLGLAICRELAEAMGGLVAVHSVPGHGSTFSFGACFRKPLNLEQHSQLDLPIQDTLRVLLCISNETNQRGLRTQFANWKCEVLAVNDPDQALELVQCGQDAGTPFHVLMLDYDVITHDLEYLVSVLRRKGGKHRIGLILMTGVHAKKEASNLQLDLDGILTKPVKRDQLLRALRAVLSSEKTPDHRSVSESHAPRTHPKEVTQYGKSILVVEDNPVNQKLALRMLERGGHTAEIADNGRIALDMLDDHAVKYDLILMDCQMPELDGYETTRVLRGKPDTKAIPIIGLTACAMKGDREKCLEAGMTDYLAKPYKPNELLNKIREWTSAAPVA